MKNLVETMRQLREVPPLPDVAHRVLAIVKDPDYSIDSLVMVVRTDPALTGKILELCNSSSFGLGREITSVSDAVAYLGTRNIVKLVVISCTAPYFTSADIGYVASPGEIWRHSVACGITCHVLAERLDFDPGGSAFTAGILHNIGKVALSQILATQGYEFLCSDPAANDSDGFLAVERRLAGIDHAAAGGIVAESWNLPADLRHAVRNHHDTDQIRCDGDLTALVHVADLMVLQMGIGVGADGLDYPVAPEALERLQVTECDLDLVRLDVLDELKSWQDLVNNDAARNR